MDKYQKGYQEFDRQYDLQQKAVDWDKAATGSTVYRNSESFLVGHMQIITIGDRLRNRQSLKVLIYVTNWRTGVSDVIAPQRWIDEKWTVEKTIEGCDVII